MNCKMWSTGWPDLKNILATTPEERASVMEVRRQAYARDASFRSVALSDSFDSTSKTCSFLLSRRHGSTSESKAVGTVRITLRELKDDPLSTPCASTFGPEINAVLRDQTFVELSRLAIQPASYQDGYRLYLALMQNGARIADEYQCDTILAPTIYQHIRLYLGMGFTQLTEPRQYTGGTRCCLMALDWRANRQMLRSHHRFNRLFAGGSRSELAA